MLLIGTNSLTTMFTPVQWDPSTPLIRPHPTAEIHRAIEGQAGVLRTSKAPK